jgi:tRNA threonylcarbamoyladenosine biosynthesis protein TsaB
VALQQDDRIIERHEEQPREHTRLLVPMIRSLLEEAQTEIRDLDAIVLGNGPGSFIGMRIAASVAQGLAFASGINIVSVSSLAAVAEQVFAEHDATEVAVTQDAHMSEVYLGIYARNNNGCTKHLIAERIHAQAAISELSHSADGRRFAAGSGWSRYPALLEHNRGRIDQVVDILHPRARYLLKLGAEGVEAGESIIPAEVVPAYLRQKVAQKPAPR